MYAEATIWGPPRCDADDASRASCDSDDNHLCVRKTQCDEDYDTASEDDDFEVPDVKLRVIRQPEEQHRARYLSEGSRGAIKDSTGNSHCTIKLSGHNRPTAVEIYAGSGSGSVAPHALYRLIAVSGKGGAGLTTPCREVIARDGIPCLEVVLRPEHNMTAILDCVGVLKICSHSVKRRVPRGARNSSIRLVLRAVVPHPLDPTQAILAQTESTPIVCVQQLGVPEVLKVSQRSANPIGGDDLFLIGRNFDRNTSVVFREYRDDGKLSWSAEAAMDKKLLHQCHIVCSVPTYRDLSLRGSVEVSFTVKCGSKSSHPIPFYYTGNGNSMSAPPTSSAVEWAPPSTPVSAAPPLSAFGAVVVEPPLPADLSSIVDDLLRPDAPSHAPHTSFGVTTEACGGYGDAHFADDEPLEKRQRLTDFPSM